MLNESNQTGATIHTPLVRGFLIRWNDDVKFSRKASELTLEKEMWGKPSFAPVVRSHTVFITASNLWLSWINQCTTYFKTYGICLEENEGILNKAVYYLNVLLMLDATVIQGQVVLERRTHLKSKNHVSLLKSLIYLLILTNQACSLCSKPQKYFISIDISVSHMDISLQIYLMQNNLSFLD